MNRQARWRRAHPWARFVEWARRRCACVDPNMWWPYYGAKGIEVRLKDADLEAIWGRDHADQMRKPSLDRRDPNGHYEVSNVRFVEFDWNSRAAWDKNIEQPPVFT